MLPRLPPATPLPPHAVFMVIRCCQLVAPLPPCCCCCPLRYVLPYPPRVLLHTFTFYLALPSYPCPLIAGSDWLITPVAPVVLLPILLAQLFHVFLVCSWCWCWWCSWCWWWCRSPDVGDAACRTQLDHPAPADHCFLLSSISVMRT